MNTQEKDLLTRLLNNLRQATNGDKPLVKDPEAAQLISDTFASTPDAAYVLTQRHLLLEMALEQAQEKIRALEHQSFESNNAAGSFLGGQRTLSETGYQGTQTNAYGQPIGRAAPASSTAPTATPSTSASATQPAIRGGSFLGTAAATATGVLGGALLFQGIEHLMGGGIGDNTMAGTPPAEDVTNITENFYGNEPDISGDTGAAGWNDNNLTDSSSAFDDPTADPIDPFQADNQGLFDQDDSGGGFLDGLFGGGDDDWV